MLASRTGPSEPRQYGALRTAGIILGGWWDRLHGRLKPGPCPFALAGVLGMPGRRLVAGPEKVLSAFGVSAGERVLEIGPGTGFYSLEAARRVRHSGRLICLDVQFEMLRETRRRVERSGFTADVVQADARALPLKRGSVDHVYLVGTLGEIPDRTRALAEIRRVLRPGGRLSVSEQLPDPDFVTPRALRRELRSAGFVEETTQGWLFYTSTWSNPHRLTFPLMTL